MNVSRSVRAPSAVGARRHSGLCRSSNSAATAGNAATVRKHGFEVLAVTVLRDEPEMLLPMPERSGSTTARAGDQRLVDEAVVLKEADEHAPEHPRDGSLGDLAVPPLLQRHRGALGGNGLVMLLLQVRGDLWRCERAFTDGFLELGDERLECREQFVSVDHAAP